MKYKPDPYLCVLAGRQLGEACKELYPGESWDLVIPIPSSPNTLRQRRFNQCSILAQELTKTFPPRSFAPRILKYLGSGIPQASLPQEKRIRNMSNAFGVSEDVTAKAILLIDDVITTGATSGSASAVLLGAGARRVDILSLAQAESWYSYQDRVQNAFFR